MAKGSGDYRSSSDNVESSIASIDSTINVASSGPNIASIIDGFNFDEGATLGSVAEAAVVVEVEVLALEEAHSKSSFVRLSMLTPILKKVIGGEDEIYDERKFRCFPPDSIAHLSKPNSKKDNNYPSQQPNIHLFLTPIIIKLQRNLSIKRRNLQKEYP